MITSIVGISQDTLSGCSVFIFLILFIMIHAALKQSNMFSEWVTVVLSFCVTSLSLIAMGGLFVSPQASSDRPVSTESPGMPVILFPYGFLGLFLLTMFASMSLAKLFGSGKRNKPVEEFLPPELVFPSKKKSKPIMPIDLPSNLNKHSPPKSHVSTDCLNRAFRDISFIEHMEPNPKPSESKAMTGLYKAQPDQSV